MVLTDTELRSFDENGFLVLHEVLGSDELREIRQAADELCALDGDRIPEDWREDYRYGALVGAAVNTGSMLCRLEYPLAKDRRFLAMVANPAILAVAADLHQDEVVLTWEDMVVKTPGSGEPVPFHQDDLFQSRASRVFSIGVYLDDSTRDPLLVYPGTHQLGPLSESQVEAWVAAAKEPPLRVPVSAGDAIVHNVRMIHGSSANTSTLRRVVYLEFRTPDQVRYDSPWDEWWLERRLSIVPAAIRERAALGWGVNPAWKTAEAKTDWSVRIPPSPGDEVYLRVDHKDIAQRRQES
ncbi:phytanoyl-CoA dioxygenase family protein [Nonomuraea sp. NPDC048901]|uniref:phytanoyl-CoA dioxygenase family protein n=1 Tax=Nonomuraea sp. NPDC048901 TaxID=3155627 RepID=UPI0033D45F64